jgi:hypothetical protein
MFYNNNDDNDNDNDNDYNLKTNLFKLSINFSSPFLILISPYLIININHNSMLLLEISFTKMTKMLFAFPI